jgi:hypothetical protein
MSFFDLVQQLLSIFLGLARSIAGTVVNHVSHSFFLKTTKSASAVEWFRIQRLVMAVSAVLGLQCFRSELKRDTR